MAVKPLTSHPVGVVPLEEGLAFLVGAAPHVRDAFEVLLAR
jgi:hypothetical protein